MAAYLKFIRTGIRTGWRASRSYSTGDGLPLTFSSPNKSFYDNVQVKQIDVNSTTGSFGILPDHVPAISVLKPGLVSVYEDDKISHFFASSGSVTINSDGTVQILVEEAATLDSFDLQAARSGLDQCQQKAISGSDRDRAEAQVGVDLYEALVKALE